MRNFPKIEELFLIAKGINEQKLSFNKSLMKIEFKVDQKDLKKINEELFYKYNKENDDQEYKEADEINVTIENINFNFIPLEEE